MSPVIATMVLLAIPVVLASVLYVMVDGTMVMPTGSHSCLGPQVRILNADQGWLVEIVTIAPKTRPAELFLEVTAPDGTVSLQRTALSGLTPDSRVEYRDANPHDSEVRPGDGIAFEAARFVDGSTLAISDGSGMITVRSLP